MPMKKIYDLAVKTGEYTNQYGETKGRWLNVGQVMQDDNGGKFILLSRAFNPAGVEVKPGRDSVILSLFEPKARDGENRSGGDYSGGNASRRGGRYSGENSGSNWDPMEGQPANAVDVPF